MHNRFLKELKVLLVEDEERLSQLLQNAIGDYFHKFYIAKDGVDGLDKFHTLKPDIVITDIMMPRLTGLEMAEKIRVINKTIPIIILSAYSETDKFLNAIDVGVVKYFIKPFDPDELLDYISSLEDKFESKLIPLSNIFFYNKHTNSLYKNRRFVALSKKEIEFMRLLIEQKQNGNYLLAEELTIKKLWGEDATKERFRTFIKRLREKTSKDLIINIKGQGYRLPLS